MANVSCRARKAVIVTHSRKQARLTSSRARVLAMTAIAGATAEKRNKRALLSVSDKTGLIAFAKVTLGT